MSEIVSAFNKEIKKCIKTKSKNQDPEFEINGKKTTIKYDKFTHFYQKYCEIAEEVLESGESLNVVQLTKQTMPFVVKYDLKFNSYTDRDVLLSDLGIAGIVFAMQEYLRSTFVFDKTPNNHECCLVSMTDAFHILRRKREMTAFNIQFHFPMCRVDTVKLVEKYIPELNGLLEKTWQGGKGIFSVKPVMTSWDAIADYSIYEKLPLYGSVAKEGDFPLQFFKAYDALPVVTKDFNEEEYIFDSDMFDPAEHTKFQNDVMKATELFGEKYGEEAKSEEVRSEDDESESDKVEGGWKWLPLILSLDYWGTISVEIEKRKKALENITLKKKKHSIQEIASDLENRTTDSRNINTRDYLLHFIEMCDASTILDPKSAFDFGEAFYDIEKGERTGLVAWMAVIQGALEKHKAKIQYFTRKNLRRICEESYNRFMRGRINTETIAWYAQRDSPEKYEEWHEDWQRKIIYSATDCNDGRVANHFWRCYWLDLKCYHDDRKGRWYYFNEHRFRYDKGGLHIKRIIGSDYVGRFVKMRNDLREQLQNDGANKSLGEFIITSIGKLIDKLTTNRFKSELLRALEENFSCDNLLDLMDQNPEVLGVPNGVIAATDRDISFREGKPQDYITKQCKVMYRKDFSRDHPTVRDAMLWAQKTFVDPEVIDYFWKFMASILRGRNNDKKLMVWSGNRGNNGKSMWVRALACVLGDYFIKMPMNLFTMGKGKANDASPMEAATNGCRVCVSEEPEESVPILSSIVKSKTGDDDEQIRELYGAPRSQTPMYKTIIVCNYPPIMTAEEAMEERVVIHPFESRWQNGAPATLRQQMKKRTFPIDPYFSKQIPALAAGILWIMYNCYGEYLNAKGLGKRPESVEKITKAYWEKNDRYLRFIKENVEEDPESFIDRNELWIRFSRWHDISFRGKVQLPDKYKALEEFERKKGMGVYMDECWHGVKLKDFGAKKKQED